MGRSRLATPDQTKAGCCRRSKPAATQSISFAMVALAILASDPHMLTVLPDSGPRVIFLPVVLVCRASMEPHRSSSTRCSATEARLPSWRAVADSLHTAFGVVEGAGLVSLGEVAEGVVAKVLVAGEVGSGGDL